MMFSCVSIQLGRSMRPMGHEGASGGVGARGLAGMESDPPYWAGCNPPRKAWPGSETELVARIQRGSRAACFQMRSTPQAKPRSAISEFQPHRKGIHPLLNRAYTDSLPLSTVGKRLWITGPRLPVWAVPAFRQRNPVASTPLKYADTQCRNNAVAPQCL